MRAIVRNLLRESLPPDPFIAAERWYGSGGVPGVPDGPFAHIKFGGNLRGIGRVERRRLEVWIYGPEGSYDGIDPVVQFVKNTLDGAAHLKDESGAELILCTWQSDSPDLWDETYRSNCIMVAFEAIGKEAP